MKRIVHTFEPTQLFNNLSPVINEMLSGTPKQDSIGMVNVYSRHTTLGLVITEDELLHFADIKKYLEGIAPRKGRYLHDHLDLRDVPCDEPINGSAHIQSLTFQASISIPVSWGELLLGKWQEIFAIDLDLEAEKTREVIITYTGQQI